MINFTQKIKEKCLLFSPFLQHNIEISSDLFQLSKGKVADFLTEIEKTSKQMSEQSQLHYAEFYAQQLIRQFELLKNTVEKLQYKPKNQPTTFKSQYKFAKNLVNLPANKRREEYQKALRALNDKISWLIQQSHQCQNIEKKAFFQAQIQETEYRKQKCIKAIEECQ